MFLKFSPYTSIWSTSMFIKETKGFIFTFYFTHFYWYQSHLIQNKEWKLADDEKRWKKWSREGRRRKWLKIWINKNIKSMWNNIQVLFLLCLNHFQHSSLRSEQYPTSVIYCSGCFHVFILCYFSAVRSLLQGLFSLWKRTIRPDSLSNRWHSTVK